MEGVGSIPTLSQTVESQVLTDLKFIQKLRETKTSAPKRNKAAWETQDAQ
jgi:hypothetical protein